jgi:hypothetical protein
MKEHTASNFRVQINHVGKVAGRAEEGKQVTQKCSIKTMNAKKQEGWLIGNNGNSNYSHFFTKSTACKSAQIFTKLTSAQRLYVQTYTNISPKSVMKYRKNG